MCSIVAVHAYFYTHFKQYIPMASLHTHKALVYYPNFKLVPSQRRMLGSNTEYLRTIHTLKQHRLSPRTSAKSLKKLHMWLPTKLRGTTRARLVSHVSLPASFSKAWGIGPVHLFEECMEVSLKQILLVEHVAGWR